jgi:hypothetical protein
MRTKIEIKIGEIYKAKEPDGSWTYFEVEKTPDYLKLKDNEVYVCTRTPYSTSVFCQIETAGVIKKDKLVPLNAKKDREMLKAIKDVQKKNRVNMQFYVSKTEDGLYHVQNCVMGMKGQHHVHNEKSLNKWKKNIDPENIRVSPLVGMAGDLCNCGLKSSGDVTEYDGKTWHNDKFEG